MKEILSTNDIALLQNVSRSMLIQLWPEIEASVAASEEE